MKSHVWHVHGDIDDAVKSARDMEYEDGGSCVRHIRYMSLEMAQCSSSTTVGFVAMNIGLHCKIKDNGTVLHNLDRYLIVIAGA